MNYPRPSTKKQLQRWIGLSNWRQRFVKQYASQMEPFYILLNKGEKRTWIEQHDQAFEETERQLTSSATLV